MARAKHVTTSDGKHYGYRFHCPGCDEHHVITTTPYPGGWTFDGDVDRPTFSPSVHVHPRWPPTAASSRRFGATRSCRAGRIQFLGDSTHALAGQTVDLPEVE